MSAGATSEMMDPQQPMPLALDFGTTAAPTSGDGASAPSPAQQQPPSQARYPPQPERQNGEGGGGGRITNVATIAHQFG